jgi:exo-poly-alpha-galacturonosidase
MRWRTIATTALCSLVLAAAGGSSAATAAATGRPAPPTNVRVPALAFDAHSITIAWEKPADHAGIVDYHVFLNGQLAGAASQDATSPAKPMVDAFYADPANSQQVKVLMDNFTATNLRPHTRYTLTVRSVDAAGQESRDSERVTQFTTPVSRVFDVTQFGAVGDGVTVNTPAIQAAIDACTPGGTVLIPAGVFKSGAVFLHSDMTLQVGAGATLLGSENAADYPYHYLLYPYSTDPRFYSLVNAHTYDYGTLRNIRIVGPGTIDGNGWKQGPPDAQGFPVSLPSSSSTVAKNGILAAAQTALAGQLGSGSPYGTRSNLITLRGVNGAYYGGFTAVNPSQHTLVNIHSNHVTVNGVRMLTGGVNNADGVEFIHGNGLTVINDVFDTGDDDMNFAAGLGAASATDVPSGHAWIADNFFRKGHGAVVAGSHTGAWIEDILAEDNVVNGTDVGLRMKTDPHNGGGARRVVFRDSALKSIAMQAFIFTSAYADPNAAIVVEPSAKLSQFHDVRVEHVTVDGTAKESINVIGVAEQLHQDLHFDGVHFLNAKPTSIQFLRDSTFHDVVFDTTPNPWGITGSTGLSFTGATTQTPVSLDAAGTPSWAAGSTLSATAVTDTSATLSWPAAADNAAVASYRILAGDPGQGLSGAMGTRVLATVPGTAQSATVTGLAPALAYHFTVVAADATGNAATGPSADVTTTGARDTTPPMTPAGAGSFALVPGSAGFTWLKVQWQPATDDFGIARYQVLANGVPASTVPVVGNPNMVSVTSLLPGTAYVLTLAAIDATGNAATYATTVSATTLPAYDRSVPRFPEDARVRARDVGATSVTLTWTAATDDQRVAGYRVYVNGKPIEGATPFTPINDASTTTDTTFTVTGLQPDTRYRFTIQAGDPANKWTGSGPSTTTETEEA